MLLLRRQLWLQLTLEKVLSSALRSDLWNSVSTNEVAVLIVSNQWLTWKQEERLAIPFTAGKHIKKQVLKHHNGLHLKHFSSQHIFSEVKFPSDLRRWLARKPRLRMRGFQYRVPIGQSSLKPRSDWSACYGWAGPEPQHGYVGKWDLCQAECSGGG